MRVRGPVEPVAHLPRPKPRRRSPRRAWTIARMLMLGAVVGILLAGVLNTAPTAGFDTPAPHSAPASR